jgi:ubiquinone/menaquinone biosynthesis C-methylase UbiE
LVKFAKVRAGQNVLDVGCGTGVVAITAARIGARVRGVDLTPELLERARENASVANVEIDFREGDAEALPFDDAQFDSVLSQFGHMFAPRPEIAIAEMLRVLRPGGTIAFATWPPDVSPPPQWGDVAIVRERIGTAVKDILFDSAYMLFPALSVQNYRDHIERTAGPMLKLVEMLSASDPNRLAHFRREYEALVAPYFEDNVVRQDYLLTRATKV